MRKIFMTPKYGGQSLKQAENCKPRQEKQASQCVFAGWTQFSSVY